MKRDWRLLLAAALLICAAVATWFDIQYMMLWSKGFWGGDWQQFAEHYAMGISKNCEYDCFPPANNWTALAAIACFVSGIISVLYAWWKPKK